MIYPQNQTSEFRNAEADNICSQIDISSVLSTRMENFPSTNSANFSHKVTAIAAGEAHTLALSGDGSVYSWGRGTFGRLGTGSEADQHYPVRLNFFASSTDGRATDDKNIKIVGIAAGAYHSLALSDDGSVWAWGYNVYGQIGGNGEYSLVPCLVEGFLGLESSNYGAHDPLSERERVLKVSSIRAGGMMSLAIDDHGSLWMWGNCPDPNKGEFELVSSSLPVPVWKFHGRAVVKVACGNEHAVALVSADETFSGSDLLCYSWGSNCHGQLGLGDKDNRSIPEVIKSFDLESCSEVYEIACGAFHTAVLTTKKKQSDTFGSDCWTFGLGDNGQLGHGTTRSCMLPELVRGLPENAFFVSIDCGLFHTSIVSSAGDVWSWGMEKGLGLCPDASFTGINAGDAVSPLLIACNDIDGSKFPEPVQVACGAAHTVLVTDKGYKLWSWGRGRSGVLGNGSTVDFFSPAPVLWPPKLEDSREEDIESAEGVQKIVGNVEGRENKGKNHEVTSDVEKKLSMAMDEIVTLQSKLSKMERYASILHGSIFGKPFEVKDIPISLQNSGTFDISREWENMLETLDESKLLQLEMFYNNMLTGVREKKMKKMIQKLIREYLNPGQASI